MTGSVTGPVTGTRHAGHEDEPSHEPIEQPIDSSAPDGDTLVRYEYTYYYNYGGNGDYYSGYGYATINQGYRTGQLFGTVPNETAGPGVYVIGAVSEVDASAGTAGELFVTSYFDYLTDGVADDNPSGGESGHLHDRPLTIYKGHGKAGLGSESGLIHWDGHWAGFDTKTFGVFSPYFDGDLIGGNTTYAPANTAPSDLGSYSRAGQGTYDEKILGDDRNNNYTGTDTNDSIDGARGNDTIKGLAGDDLLKGSRGRDAVYGGDGDDSLRGGYGADIVFGDGGNDVIWGGDGNDYPLFGGDGHDAIYGETGDDFLGGDAGWDTLTGGLGSDRFYFLTPNDGIDTLTDFSTTDDQIWVSAQGFADANLNPVLTAYAVITPDQLQIGTQALDTSDRFIYNPTTGALFFDVDGTGTGEFPGTNPQVLIAKLAPGLTFTNNHIYVSG